MEYTADNMSRFIGPDGTDEDAQKIGEYLGTHGWELVEIDGQFVAYRNGEEMTEYEWQEALNGCFAN